jgi:hypothetical protein
MHYDLRQQCKKLARLNLIPNIFGEPFGAVFSQKYHGDVTIIPDMGLTDSLKAISHPNEADMKKYIAEGQRATWPHCPRLQSMMSIETALDDLYSRLMQEASGLPIQRRPSVEFHVGSLDTFSDDLTTFTNPRTPAMPTSHHQWPGTPHVGSDAANLTHVQARGSSVSLGVPRVPKSSLASCTPPASPHMLPVEQRPRASPSTPVGFHCPPSLSPSSAPVNASPCATPLLGAASIVSPPPLPSSPTAVGHHTWSLPPPVPLPVVVPTAAATGTATTAAVAAVGTEDRTSLFASAKSRGLSLSASATRLANLVDTVAATSPMQASRPPTQLPVSVTDLQHLSMEQLFELRTMLDAQMLARTT